MPTESFYDSEADDGAGVDNGPEAGWARNLYGQLRPDAYTTRWDEYYLDLSAHDLDD